MGDVLFQYHAAVQSMPEADMASLAIMCVPPDPSKSGMHILYPEADDERIRLYWWSHEIRAWYTEDRRYYYSPEKMAAYSWRYLTTA